MDVRGGRRAKTAADQHSPSDQARSPFFHDPRATGTKGAEKGARRAQTAADPRSPKHLITRNLDPGRATRARH